MFKNLILSLLTTCWLTGCMSLLSLTDYKGMRPYLATRADAGYVLDGGRLPEKSETSTMVVILCAIDLPMSFVVDTLLLPYTIPNYFVLQHKTAEYEKKKATGSATQGNAPSTGTQPANPAQPQ